MRIFNITELDPSQYAFGWGIGTDTFLFSSVTNEIFHLDANIDAWRSYKLIDPVKGLLESYQLNIPFCCENMDTQAKALFKKRLNTSQVKFWHKKMESLDSDC